MCIRGIPGVPSCVCVHMCSVSVVVHSILGAVRPLSQAVWFTHSLHI